MDYEFVKGQFTEAQLEAAIIEIFQQQDYIYVHGEKIHRQYEDILLEEDFVPSYRGGIPGRPSEIRNTGRSQSVGPHPSVSTL